MIKVKVLKQQIIITGHADFADYGKDIVCASCSSIIITSINCALRYKSDSIKYQELKDKLVIDILSDDKVVAIIIDNMLAMLSELALTYKKNIKIVKEDAL